MNETPPAKGFARIKRTPRARKDRRPGKIGVLLVNLGTPDGTDYWSVRRYLKEFLSDRRVIETNRALWWVILNGVVLTEAVAERREIPRRVERGAERIALAHHHPRASEEVAAALAAAPISWSIGRCATAARASPRASRRSQAQGLRPPARLSALSAIFVLDHGERERQGVRCAEASAISPRSHRSSLPRRSRLYRRAGAIDQDASCRARLGAGGDPRLLSRTAQELCRQGRSLLARNAR